MPIPVIETIYTPERQRLILILESTLHFLVREPMSREEALDLKQRITRPIGVLNSKNGLRSEAEAKRAVRHGQMSIDTRTPKD